MKAVSTPTSGMITDVELLAQSENSYTYALNATYESTSGDGFVLQNDYSNILGAVLSEGENVIGKKFITELDLLILFTTNNRILSLSHKIYNDSGLNLFGSEDGSIPVTPSNTVTTLNIRVLIDSSCFNWNIQYKVDLQYKITDSTLNLYFVDNGYNPDRYIYFNLKDLSLEETFKKIISYDQYSNPVYSQELDCNTITWYPELSTPSITTSDLEGGNLKAGVYQFMVAFATSKGIALTAYKSATNPFHLFTKPLTTVTDYNTGKAIQVKVGNINTVGRYRYVNIASIETIEGVTTYKLIATIPVAPTIIYTYTGDSKAISLDEVDLFQLYPFYKSSAGITKANNRLYKFGIKEFEKFNLQPIVNQMNLKWFTVSAKEGSYAKAEFAQNYRTYMRDEVYTFGIIFILDNGEQTQVYPFIGRPMNIDDRLIVINKDVVKSDDDCNPPQFLRRHQVYNTGYVTRTSKEADISVCEFKQYQEGEFSYHESTERYPSIVEEWGEYANQPMRFFKMPDCLISPIQNGNANSPVDYKANNVIYPLGVKLDETTDIENLLNQAVSEQLISQYQKDRIRGYKIVRGNRVGHNSVIAKGWTSNVWLYNDKDTLTYYPNYGFNDLRRDPYLLNQELKNQTADYNTREQYRAEFFPERKYTFHSPDTSFTEPSLGDIFKVESEMYGNTEGFFSKSRGQGEYIILNQLHYNFAIVVGWLLTSKLELEKAQPGSQGQAIGSGVGAVVGGVIGAFAGGVGAPLGAALGSGLGGIIGKLVGGNTSDNKYNAMYQLSMWISQTDRILELLQNTIPMQNYHWQYQAIGKYTNIEPVENAGFKQRRILNSAYVKGGREVLPGNIRFNNNFRESTVYLELEDEIGLPKNIDNSKVNSKKLNGDCYEEYEQVFAKTSAFYTSIKRNITNQYGSIFNIDWIPTSNKVWNIKDKFEEFGGDSYINRFAFRRNHNFFVNTAYKLPDRLDIYYEDQANIAYPLYFFNTRYTELQEPAQFTLKALEGMTNAAALLLSLNNIESPQTLTDNAEVQNFELEGLQNAIAEMFRKTVMNPFYTTRPPRYLLDCAVDKFVEYLSDYVVVPVGNFWKGKNNIGIPNMSFDFTGVKGRIYTYNYAVPYFLCESGINIDLRYATNPNEGDFYPHQTNLDYWMQEENVSPKVDNTYNYNRVYSKQNHEEIINRSDINFIKEKDKISYPNMLVYSQDGADVENSNFKDNYLYFKPLDSKNFSFENGKLVSVDAIESGSLLLRFENNTAIIPLNHRLTTQDGLNIALGDGQLFATYQEFTKTDSGYIGSQHTDILNTEFGHIVVDAKRGNIFNIQSGGKGVDELTKDGMRNWMAENLPFKISQYFPEVNIDNAFNHIGISLSYDKRFKRFFLTKLDYIPLLQGIEYKDGNFYYKQSKIDVRDKQYFCNASWTISYSFYKKSFTSFHSFTPDYYLDGLNKFYTGINGTDKGLSSVWVHNMTNKSYQKYYGQLKPFEVELATKTALTNRIITEVGFLLDTVRMHNHFDKARVEDVSFTKAVVFNEVQNSGILNLDMIDENDLYSLSQYPIKEETNTRILLKKTENIFSFNQFKDISFKNNLPRFINTCNNANKVLNLKAIDYNNLTIDNNYIRSQKAFVKLTNDKYDQYKFIFRGLIVDETPSI